MTADTTTAFQPPASTPLLNTTIFDNTMPAPLFRSFARLYAMAWGHNYQHTEPLDFELEIIPLLNISRTQAREHLRLLRFAKLIDWTSNGSHQYTIYFLSPENRTQPDPRSGKPDSSSPEFRTLV